MNKHVTALCMWKAVVLVIDKVYLSNQESVLINTVLSASLVSMAMRFGFNILL